MPKAKKTKPTAGQQHIPLIWHYPEDVMSGYATNILVQAGEQELYVSFFEAQPPVLLGPEDVKKLESVTAECIARIVLTPDRAAKFIEVLEQQLKAFKDKQAAEKSNASSK